MIVGPHEASQRAQTAVAAQRQRRQNIVLSLYVAGLGPTAIAARIGCSRRTVERDLSEIEPVRKDVDDLLADEPVDARDIHLRLSQMFDANIKDIVDEETGEFRPVHEWPDVWSMGLAGEVTIEPVSERSKDGGHESWDVVGTRVKIKRESLTRLIELLGRLKSVDALVKTGDSAKDVASEVMSEIDKRIAAGRQRAAQSRVVAQIESAPVIDVEASDGQT